MLNDLIDYYDLIAVWVRGRFHALRNAPIGTLKLKSLITKDYMLKNSWQTVEFFDLAIESVSGSYKISGLDRGVELTSVNW
jgi:hypothetical protein